MATDNDLNKDILEAVQKNLPAHTVGVLQKELAELERLRGVDQTLKESYKANQDLIQHRAELMREIAAWKYKEEKLTAREKAVTGAEIRLEVTTLKIKLEESDKRSDIIKDLAQTVFRNETVQKTIFENGTSQWNSNLFGPGNGGSQFVPTGGSTETVTKI